MRTTLNLDDDVAEQLKERARRTGRSISMVTTNLIRSGLAHDRCPDREPYEPPILSTGQPALDVTDVAAALEQLDDHAPRRPRPSMTAPLDH